MSGFDEVILGLKKGKTYQRTSWQDQYKFIFKVDGSKFKASREPLVSLFGQDANITYHSHVDMRTEHGHIMPWFPSNEDMFAEDWREYPPEKSKSTDTTEYEIHYTFDNRREANTLCRLVRNEIIARGENTIKFNEEDSVLTILQSKALQIVAADLKDKFIAGGKDFAKAIPTVLENSYITSVYYTDLEGRGETIGKCRLLGHARISVQMKIITQPDLEYQGIQSKPDQIFKLTFSDHDMAWLAFKNLHACMYEEMEDQVDAILAAFLPADIIQLKTAGMTDDQIAEVDLNVLLLDPNIKILKLEDYKVGSKEIQVTLRVV